MPDKLSLWETSWFDEEIYNSCLLLLQPYEANLLERIDKTVET